MANERRLREVIEMQSGFDAELWQKMAQLGLTGIMVEPEHEGIGGSIMEVEALMEHAGEYLYCGPFISTCVIASTILNACHDDAFASTYLKGITEGTAIFSVAGCGKDGDWSQRPEVEAEKNDEHWCLTGTAGFVSHAAIANYCLVYANTDSGKAVFLANMDESSIEVTSHKTNDSTLRLSSLSFNKVKAHRLTFENNTTHENVLISGYELELVTPYATMIKE